MHTGNLGIESMHVGAEGPQGFLYYYFFMLAPRRLRAAAGGRTTVHGRGRYIDKCVFNANLLYCSPSNTLGGEIHMVHKPAIVLSARKAAALARGSSGSASTGAGGKAELASADGVPLDDATSRRLPLELALFHVRGSNEGTVLCTFGKLADRHAARHASASHEHNPTGVSSVNATSFRPNPATDASTTFDELGQIQRSIRAKLRERCTHTHQRACMHTCAAVAPD